jgi:redox-sensitive bicupin YhaK (pirin superfamily)
MLTVRKAEDRGRADFGWLNSHHTFSFGNYYDPKFEGFRALRVINDDRVQPGMGFGTHGHRDMEIISYVLEGELEHKDNMGTGSIIKPGEVQRMSAGRGVMHSEYNHSKTEAVHFLQIWIIPAKAGIDPGYEQKAFPEEQKRGKFRLVASQDGAEGSVTIHQDARLYIARLGAGEETSVEVPATRYGCLHVATGSVQVNGIDLKAGDGVAVEKEPRLTVTGKDEAEVLWFDLA